MKFISLAFLGAFVFLFVPHMTYAEETKTIIVEFKNDKEKTFSANTDQDINTIEVPVEKAEEKMKELKESPEVEYAEFEVFYELFETPNDPLYNQQQGYFQNINLPEVWDSYTPSDKPTVAVLDSGINQEHEDLSEAIVKPYNVIEKSNEVIDNVGHGTHVAGIAGAITDNNTGGASVGRNVNIIPVKVGDSTGISSVNIAKGINYAAENGADVINLSLGGDNPSLAVENAVKEAVEKDIVVVAAAGNDSSTTKQYPAALKNVISVGAVEESTKKLASFSNYGDWVDVTAPGDSILSSCTKGDRWPFSSCKSSYPYVEANGTSMAAPVVSSYAALMKSHTPSLTNEQIRYLIEEPSISNSAVRFGTIDALSSLSKYQTESRLSGKTSVDTSIEISMKGWPEGVPDTEIKGEGLTNISGKTAILANNSNFADGLTANTLAGQLDAPILLTFPNRISEETVSELERLQVENVIIAGGTAAVSREVEAVLAENDFNPIRLSGPTRYSTAAEMNAYSAEKNGEVIVVSGENFPDALAVSSYANQQEIPIVFVKENTIPEATQEFLNEYDFSKAYVIGGTGVISDTVKNKLPNAERISGSTRYETALEVIKRFNEDADSYLLATGENFSDALAGGALAGRENHALLLSRSNSIPESVRAFVANKQYEANTPDDFYTLGGKAAITNPVLWQMDSLIYPGYYTNRLSNPDLKKR